MLRFLQPRSGDGVQPWAQALSLADFFSWVFEPPADGEELQVSPATPENQPTRSLVAATVLMAAESG